jgi:PucR C-terminal helix-turn-helix domain/Purine catabolism regulatory protein-like family/GGDEF-like domain
VLLSALVESADGGLVPVSGPGPDPEVGSVVTTDLLDPGRYLNGGELVLTGLAWWRPGRPARSRRFVAALVQARVAALAAGEAALGGVPDDLVGACGDAGLPLLRVPVDVSFATVTDRASRLLSSHEGLLAVLARHRALVAAVAAREGAGLSTVLDLVARDLGVAGWVLSATGRLIAASGDIPDEETRRSWARRYLAAVRLPLLLPNSIPTSFMDAAPGPVTLVSSGPGSGWFLALADDHSGWTAGRQAVVAELTGLVGLELQLAGRRPDGEVELTRALDGVSAAEVERAAQRLGWDLTRPAVVVVATGRAASLVLAETLAAEGFLWAEVGDGAIGLVRTSEPPTLVAQLRAVVDFLAPRDELRIGVSDAVTGAAALLGAVAEARAAAAGGAVGSTSDHTVAGPEALSSHALLLAAVPLELRESYRRRVLGPLLDHDRAHRTDLVRTLAAYLECSGSWSRCATAMHLHVNTVRYRIERIEALSGRDLRRLEDQMDLLLALHLPA